MKGITPIISIIVLLLITVSLAGAAYMFLGGYMTAYTGRAIQTSGICLGGTEAFITVTNMGTLPIDLGTCDASGGDGTTPDMECGDIIVIKTDGSNLGTASSDALFSADNIPAAELDNLHRVTFRDPGCTTTGNSKTCKYAFTRAGEIQPILVSVGCSG